MRDLPPDNASTGLVAGIFGLSAGVIHICAGTAAGLDPDFLMLGVISYLMINGLFGLIMPALYRLPMPMTNSIQGANALNPTAAISAELMTTPYSRIAKCGCQERINH